MPTATKPPYQTGVYPQPALEALLSDELLPSLWPDHALGGMTIERARFSPGKDLALLCALTLRAGDGDRDQRVLVTFAPEKRLEKAAHRYLDCGIFAQGAARVHCEECGHDFLVAFSCKQRCLCPSCHQERELLWAQ